MNKTSRCSTWWFLWYHIPALHSLTLRDFKVHWLDLQNMQPNSEINSTFSWRLTHKTHLDKWLSKKPLYSLLLYFKSERLVTHWRAGDDMKVITSGKGQRSRGEANYITSTWACNKEPTSREEVGIPREGGGREKGGNQLINGMTKTAKWIMEAVSTRPQNRWLTLIFTTNACYSGAQELHEAQFPEIIA